MGSLINNIFSPFTNWCASLKEVKLDGCGEEETRSQRLSDLATYIFCGLSRCFSIAAMGCAAGYVGSKGIARICSNATLQALAANGARWALVGLKISLCAAVATFLLFSISALVRSYLHADGKGKTKLDEKTLSNEQIDKICESEEEIDKICEKFVGKTDELKNKDENDLLNKILGQLTTKDAVSASIGFKSLGLKDPTSLRFLLVKLTLKGSIAGFSFIDSGEWKFYTKQDAIPKDARRLHTKYDVVEISNRFSNFNFKIDTFEGEELEIAKDLVTSIKTNYRGMMGSMLYGDGIKSIPWFQYCMDIEGKGYMAHEIEARRETFTKVLDQMVSNGSFYEWKLAIGRNSHCASIKISKEYTKAPKDCERTKLPEDWLV